MASSNMIQQHSQSHPKYSFGSSYSFSRPSAHSFQQQLTDQQQYIRPDMADETAVPSSPPAPPSPSQDTGLIPDISRAAKNTKSIQSPPLDPTAWDVDTLQPEVAMKWLARGVQGLAQVTGDVPPTPPIARPLTPSSSSKASSSGHSRHHRRTASRPGTPISPSDMRQPNFQNISVGQPEAGPDEPQPGDVGYTTESAEVQQMRVARKFFCKTAPPVSLEQYLTRIHGWCPMSTAVYLAAGGYIHKLCIQDKLVPATSRTVHRLLLASLRVAMKALEDLRYSQERFAAVGGVKQQELRNLEISLCYLMDFQLQATSDALQNRMSGLLQAAGLAGRFQLLDMALNLPPLGPKS